MMINEHISKDSFPSESCPKGKELCEYGFQTCVYTRNRFKVIRCCPSYQEKANKVHKKELEDRQALNVPRWDYKENLDLRKKEKVMKEERQVKYP